MSLDTLFFQFLFNSRNKKKSKEKKIGIFVYSFHHSDYHHHAEKFAKGISYYMNISMVDEGRVNADDDNKTKSTYRDDYSEIFSIDSFFLV